MTCGWAKNPLRPRSEKFWMRPDGRPTSARPLTRWERLVDWWRWFRRGRKLQVSNAEWLRFEVVLPSEKGKQ